MKWCVVTGLVVVLFASLVACKGGSESGPKSTKSKSAAKPTTVVRRIAPQVLWRTPYKGRLRTLALAGDVLVVTSRGRGDRSSARRLAGFSSTTGKLLWEKVTRVRLYERNVGWSTSKAQVGGILAVAKTAHRVVGIDPQSGTRKWEIRATGGVVSAGVNFAVASLNEVKLLAPTDGAEVLRLSLGDPRSGAPGNGLMDRLKPGTLINASADALLLSRRHGGALQALHSKTLAKRWQFHNPRALPTRPDRQAVGRNSVLVPVLQPSRENESSIRVWPPFQQGGTPLWTATVPGRVSRRLTFVTKTHVVGISRSRTRQSLLWRVDRKTGKLVDARTVPMPHFCYVGAQTLICKRTEGVSAHALDTLKRRWHFVQPRGQNIRSMRYADGLVVLEVGRQLVALDVKDGRQLFTVKRRLGEHDFGVVRLLGVSGGRVLVAVRHLEDTAWGDRLILLGLSVSNGAIALNKRLGRYPKQGAPVWPGAPEKLPGTLPVILVRAGNGHPDRVVSVFGKSFQVLDAKTGRSLFARGIPPQTDREVRLLRRDRGLAVYRRGNGLFGVNLAGNRLDWRASLWKTPLHRAFGHVAFVKGPKGRLELRPQKAPDPARRGLVTLNREKCKLRYAEPGRWFCQTPRKLLVINATSGVVITRLDRAHNVFRDKDLVLATYASSRKTARPDAWVAVDLRTGKPRWRIEAAGDKAEVSALPPPFDREHPDPARWTWAGLGLFAVTSVDGRCIHAVHQATGKAAFKSCFGALAGPPLVFGKKLLVAARPSSPQGGKVPAEQRLYLLDPGTGKARRIFDPGPGQRVVLGSAAVRAGVLYATVGPTKGVTTRNQVLALRLYAKP
jgi:outer membrane protein assembly factor BamB